MKKYFSIISFEGQKRGLLFYPVDRTLVVTHPLMFYSLRWGFRGRDIDSKTRKLFQIITKTTTQKNKLSPLLLLLSFFQSFTFFLSLNLFGNEMCPGLFHFSLYLTFISLSLLLSLSLLFTHSESQFLFWSSKHRQIFVMW